MPSTLTSPLRILAVAAALYLLVPPARGPVLLAAAGLLVVCEYRTRRAHAGTPIDVIVDGAAVRVAASGGSVPYADGTITVRREGGSILIDERPVTAGDIIERGSCHIEVVR